MFKRVNCENRPILYDSNYLIDMTKITNNYIKELNNEIIIKYNMDEKDNLFFKIYTNNFILSFDITIECCEFSHINLINDPNILINKKISYITYDENINNKNFNNINFLSDYNKCINLYTIHFINSNNIFSFTHTIETNSIYQGIIEFNIKSKNNKIKIPEIISLSKIIFVVGLPGSGKTTYINNFFNDNYIKIDDYEKGITTDYVLYENLNLIYTNGRITNINFFEEIFQYFINKVKNSNKQIKIIRFKPNVKLCRKNIISRNHKIKISNDSYKNYIELFNYIYFKYSDKYKIYTLNVHQN